jgi:hypothetical protein
MEISSASQQFAVAEQKTIAYRRKQQLVSKPVAPAPNRNVVVKPIVSVIVPAQPVAEAEDTEQVSLQSDDKKGFNAFQTIGMVKRILAQLSSHTSEWLDKPLTAELRAKQTENTSFSASFAAQSVSLTSNPSQQSNDNQWLATTEWEYGYQAVQASFSGELSLNNGDTLSFALDFNISVSWMRYSYSEQRLQDPLTVSLSGSAVQLTDDSTEFDLLANGDKIKLPQLAARQYYLAYDRNQDYLVNNGTELFGPQSGQGFAELAEFDDNGNGFIDPADDIWQYLYLWRPEQNLLTMQQADLSAISITSVATPMPLYNNQQQLAGQLQRSGLAFSSNGTPALVQQIDVVV